MNDVALFHPRLARRRALGRLFYGLCFLLSVIGIVVLGVLIVRVAQHGGQWLSWQFLKARPSTLNPTSSGVYLGLWGTVYLLILTALIAIPTGVGAAIYLQEYAGNNRLTRFIRLNIANLAGVPSIVYGILGMAIFVRWFTLGESVLSGALTLSLLILPVIIIASQEALSAVPNSIRLAAYSLGATRWQVVRHHVLPAAIPSICTGVILALSRAVGETAPLIMIGAVGFQRSVPMSPLDRFTALPIQIYGWTAEALPIFHELAAAGILVLLAVLLVANAIAIGIRGTQQRKKLQ